MITVYVPARPLRAAVARVILGWMRRPAPLFLLALTACAHAPLAPGRYAVLPASEAAAAVEQCSRWTPKITGGWELTAADAEQVEQALRRNSRLRATECCFLGARMPDPDGYYRQYAGVIYEGKRYVYVNAFAMRTVSNAAWRTHAFNRFCDGGSAFWGVLYDPATGRMSHLAFNGTA